MRFQSRWFLLVLSMIFLGGLNFLTGPWVFGNLQSKDISLAPYGYEYQKMPFTGFVYRRYTNGNLGRLAFIWQGKLHFKDWFWYSNGQLKKEKSYWMGKPHGLQKMWHPTGEPLAYGNYENGVRVGESWNWHKNGTTAGFYLYDQGHEVVTRNFTSENRPFHNYVRHKNGISGMKGERNCDPAFFNRKK